ncbi:hypothetical protein [Winogradskyella schleiferi]|uniref:hypothetical protein n=1 Tax=Winogradskyella schleiferi TaxID=2686078 RepID=UPI0015B82936|nr:hypothetical protein [Winogradskyella schleiferi]
MRKYFHFILICAVYYNCTTNRAELVLLGTVHDPVENFNADSLYNILTKIKPDLILFEVDSSFFTKAFEFKKTWDSNENVATIRYMNNFEVDIRPYEFTGRNKYRIKIGSRPTDNKATQLLDSLYSNNLLSPLDEKTYNDYLRVNDSLISRAYLGANSFNSLKTDRIAQKRQGYQYKKLLDIMRNYPIFQNTYYIKHTGDSICYLEGYKKAAEFWDLRNQTMANNIFHFIREYKGKKIVVLNGFFHRYYLNAIIRPKQNELNFTVKEFYDY